MLHTRCTRRDTEIEIKKVLISSLTILPDGVRNISQVLSVSFDDLIDSNSDVLERCEHSLKKATRVMNRRAKILEDLFLELIDVGFNIYYSILNSSFRILLFHFFFLLLFVFSCCLSYFIYSPLAHRYSETTCHRNDT